ncbi:hypothetical protein L596_001244 [Steinernema carpocapsae]|uniref:Uncharacterized protein n=1 Tax=Steinernema carpocapsae TaxID=34508 RepID=A0A4U8UKX4_STECR|nr:hypothetical protein L596_001244 [Steinernema carpocapsae]
MKKRIRPPLPFNRPSLDQDDTRVEEVTDRPVTEMTNVSATTGNNDLPPAFGEISTSHKDAKVWRTPSHPSLPVTPDTATANTSMVQRGVKRKVRQNLPYLELSKDVPDAFALPPRIINILTPEEATFSDAYTLELKAFASQLENLTLLDFTHLKIRRHICRARYNIMHTIENMKKWLDPTRSGRDPVVVDKVGKEYVVLDGCVRIQILLDIYASFKPDRIAHILDDTDAEGPVDSHVAHICSKFNVKNWTEIRVFVRPEDMPMDDLVLVPLAVYRNIASRSGVSVFKAAKCVRVMYAKISSGESRLKQHERIQIPSLALFLINVIFSMVGFEFAFIVRIMEGIRDLIRMPEEALEVLEDMLLKIADGELAFGGKSFVFAHDGDVAELTSFGPSDVPWVDEASLRRNHHSSPEFWNFVPSVFRHVTCEEQTALGHAVDNIFNVFLDSAEPSLYVCVVEAFLLLKIFEAGQCRAYYRYSNRVMQYCKEKRHGWSQLLGMPSLWLARGEEFDKGNHDASQLVRPSFKEALRLLIAKSKADIPSPIAASDAPGRCETKRDSSGNPSYDVDIRSGDQEDSRSQMQVFSPLAMPSKLTVTPKRQGSKRRGIRNRSRLVHISTTKRRGELRKALDPARISLMDPLTTTRQLHLGSRLNEHEEISFSESSPLSLRSLPMDVAVHGQPPEIFYVDKKGATNVRALVSESISKIEASACSRLETNDVIVALVVDRDVARNESFSRLFRVCFTYDMFTVDLPFTSTAAVHALFLVPLRVLSEIGRDPKFASSHPYEVIIPPTVLAVLKDLPRTSLNGPAHIQYVAKSADFVHKGHLSFSTAK